VGRLAPLVTTCPYAVSVSPGEPGIPRSGDVTDGRREGEDRKAGDGEDGKRPGVLRHRRAAVESELVVPHERNIGRSCPVADPLGAGIRVPQTASG